jgi:hypothetical protein
MQLVSRRATVSEVNGGTVEQGLDALQRREPPALLAHDVL